MGIWENEEDIYSHYICLLRRRQELSANKLIEAATVPYLKPQSCNTVPT